MKVTPALLKRLRFTRDESRFGDVCWTHGYSTIAKAKPTLDEVIAAIYQDGHAAGYHKAQADMQAAAKAFLGPLGLLPDARAQQMERVMEPRVA